MSYTAKGTNLQSTGHANVPNGNILIYLESCKWFTGKVFMCQVNFGFLPLAVFYGILRCLGPVNKPPMNPFLIWMNACRLIEQGR